MGRRKQGDDDETVKSRLIEKLGEFFFTRDIASLTMDGLAKAFSLSKKTLYRFFPTKEAMILQVSKIFGARIKAFVDKRIAMIEKEGPSAFIPRTREMLAGLGSILLSVSPKAVYAMEKETPLAFETIDAMRRRIIMESFSRILDIGKGFGAVRRDIDSGLAAHIYAGMIRQIVSRHDLGPEHAPYEVYLTVIKIMFEGILEAGSKEAFGAQALPKMERDDPWGLLSEREE
jgi:TetR/AcrR family transcriptional regulator, fatty acid metabolism regulator protein